MRMKTSRFGVWLLVMACFGNAGCRPASEEAPLAKTVPAIAVVDGRPVPVEKLDHEWERVARTGRTPDFQKVLDELIERERLVARALRLGLDREPSVRRSWESALIAKLKERELEPALKAAVEGADATVEASTSVAKDTEKEQVRLAVLRLDVSPRTSAEKAARLKARLEEARNRLSELPAEVLDFGPLATDYSDDDASRIRGGDLGWMEPDPTKCHLETGVLAAGFALQQPGQVSQVVCGAKGYYLVRLMGRRKVDETAGKTAREHWDRHQRQLEARKSIEEAFLEETRRSIPVEVREDVVAQLQSKHSLAASEHGVPAGPSR